MKGRKVPLFWSLSAEQIEETERDTLSIHQGCIEGRKLLQEWGRRCFSVEAEILALAVVALGLATKAIHRFNNREKAIIAPARQEHLEGLLLQVTPAPTSRVWRSICLYVYRMYRQQQEILRSAEDVLLYRGISGQLAEDIRRGKKTWEARTLESWSNYTDIGGTFAGEEGVVLCARIPRERILTSHEIEGGGIVDSFLENEYIVINPDGMFDLEFEICCDYKSPRPQNDGTFKW